MVSLLKYRSRVIMSLLVIILGVLMAMFILIGHLHRRELLAFPKCVTCSKCGMVTGIDVVVLQSARR